MTNAIKFTAADGEIQLTVAPRPNGVLICLRDTGAGMTSEQLDQLYKPFARLHDELITGGTGLGLYIAYGLAGSLGGKLTAQSDGPGKGSTFCLLLPSGQVVKAHVHKPTTSADDELERRLRQLI